MGGRSSLRRARDESSGLAGWLLCWSDACWTALLDRAHAVLVCPSPSLIPIQVYFQFSNRSFHSFVER